MDKCKLQGLKPAGFVFILLGLVLFSPAVIGAEVAISLTGSGWDAGTRGPEARVESAEDAWTLTNDGDGDIVVAASVDSSGDWTVSDEGTPAVDEFGFGSGDIVIPAAGAQISPVLSANDTYDFGLWLAAPAKGSSEGDYTLTVTLTASAWSCGDDFVDTRDGNTYSTVAIGGQCWMEENLAYLPDDAQMVDATDWEIIGYSAPQYAVYGVTGGTLAEAKATDNYQAYGVLYNWPAAMDGSETEGAQGVCPTAWHLPTDAEIKTLEMYLGMSEADADATGWRYSGDVGGKLKEAGTEHWNSETCGAATCNSSGFTALPGGRRRTDGSFNYLGSNGDWWSSSSSGTSAWRRGLHHDNSSVYRSTVSQARGFSLRCLRD
jgi:uncharacterized protein (TIGR02145 family)